jgi:hypothetical protein
MELKTTVDAGTIEASGGVAHDHLVIQLGHRLAMLFYDHRPAVANRRDLAEAGEEFVLVAIKLLPTSATAKLGKMLPALLSEVSPFFGCLAEFAECRPIGHQAAQAGRASAAQGHDDRVQSTSTDASLYKPGALQTFRPYFTGCRDSTTPIPQSDDGD